jgi:uncharacterized membrane protein (DUF373 family)
MVICYLRASRGYRKERRMPPKPSRTMDQIGRVVEPWLERADQAIYVLVAVLFLTAAVAMGVYSVVTFVRHMNQDFPLELVTFINDLLLVLIILEVLGTVRSYLSTGTTSLTPFLYIGIISATRRILAIGASTTLGAAASDTAFNHQMIDLGANGGIVLALAIALFLFSRQSPKVERESADGPEEQRWK